MPDPSPDSAALQLARWATSLQPTAADRALADRSLVDTLAVALAAPAHADGREVARLVADLPEVTRWSALGHVLDFDDLHMPSTTHISVVTVPVALAVGGADPVRAYLAGAGVMARLGTALGWSHYSAGWHATCTAGAPAAAVTAAVALGLDAEATARALVLALPAAGGVQRAFGTHAKSLQVGFAAEAGVRAARLAAAGATADLRALPEWLRLVGGDPARLAADRLDLDGDAVPGGLAIKIAPCCYALQRPIAAVREAAGDTAAADVVGARVTTARGTVQPLVHSRPRSGLEGKFSLEYSVATALLDRFPGFAAFGDDAVRRPEAQRLLASVEVVLPEGGEGLLDGQCTVELRHADGTTSAATLDLPPGAPGRPPSEQELAAKVQDCTGSTALLDVTWDQGADVLRKELA